MAKDMTKGDRSLKEIESEGKSGLTGPRNESDRTPSNDKEMGESKDETDSFKRGGKAKKRKAGGHVDGKKPAMRLDKRASGGRMSGHSPFTKAASIEGRPGGKYDGSASNDREDD